MTEKRSLESVLRELYGREINVSIASFYDAGWTVRIGDEMNGYTAEREFGGVDLGQIGDWIAETAGVKFMSEEEPTAANGQLGWTRYVQKWPPLITMEEWLSAAHPDVPALPLKGEDGSEAHSLMVEPLGDGEVLVCMYDAHGKEISTAWSPAQYSALRATARALSLKPRVLTFLPAAKSVSPAGEVVAFGRR